MVLKAVEIEEDYYQEQNQPISAKILANVIRKFTLKDAMECLNAAFSYLQSRPNIISNCWKKAKLNAASFHNIATTGKEMVEKIVFQI